MSKTEKTHIACKTSRIFNDLHVDVAQINHSKPNQNRNDPKTNFVFSTLSSSNGQWKATASISINGKDTPLPINNGNTKKVFDDDLTVTTVSVSKNVNTLDNKSSTNLRLDVQNKSSTANLKMT